MRTLVYYVATSVDGFIADADGGTDVFPVDPETLRVLFGRYPETCPTHLRAPLGVTAPSARFDTVVMGYRTLEPALQAGLTSAYPHLRQVVATHRPVPDDPTLERVEGDVAARVAELKQQDGRGIWLCGGGDLAAQLVHQIDELQLKVNPVVLGSGVPLFAGGVPATGFRLVSAEPLPGDVVLLTYRRAMPG